MVCWFCSYFKHVWYVGFSEVSKLQAVSALSEVQCRFWCGGQLCHLLPLVQIVSVWQLLLQWLKMQLKFTGLF